MSTKRAEAPLSLQAHVYEEANKVYAAAAAENKNGRASVVMKKGAIEVKRQSNGNGGNAELEYDSEVTYSLSEAAEMLKSYPQYILSLITRKDFAFLGLRKYSESGGRETYQFTKRQINKLKKIIDLIDSRKPPREAAYMIEKEDEHQELAHQLASALLSWISDPDDESWMDLVEALSKSPTVDDIERQALMGVEGSGESLGQCANQLNVREREVKNILDSAKAKIGLKIFDMLRMISEKK